MLEVFKSRPHLVSKVWGGRKLHELFGKDLPADEPYGESWEVADLDEGHSSVDGGMYDGESLSALVDRFGARLVGTASSDGRFPLLVKLLDAARDLSVQVHPGPDDLAARPGAPSKGQSKDECWLILDADPGAGILHGLRQSTDGATFRAAVKEGRVVDMLTRVEVSAGDVFRVPPGTIHAICAGVALLEIQQPSDTTYRVYDYGRPGLDGKPRELHIEDALAVARLEPSLPEYRGLDRSPGAMIERAQCIANVDAYRIESLRSSGSDANWAVSPHTAQVVHLLSGRARLNDVELRAGETAVVPAEVGRVWLTDAGECELVAAGLGGGPLLAND